VTIGISIIVADQLLAIFGGLSQQFYASDILFGSVPIPFVQGGQPAPTGSYEVCIFKRTNTS
jgi:branched-chain amino acid transport system permease protein